MNAVRTGNLFSGTIVASVFVFPLSALYFWFILTTMQARPSLAATLPFGLALALFCIVTLCAAALGKRWAVAAIFVFVIFGLSLSLRTRAYGETGLDWQNGMKLAAWAFIVGLAVLHAGRLAAYFRQTTIALAAAFGIMAVLSSAWSLTPAYTAANAIGMIAYLALACMTVSSLGVDATLKLVTDTLLVYIALALIAGVLLPDMAWLPPSVTETSYRLRGLSGHPNVLGEQAALLMTFAAIAHRRGVSGTPVLALSLLLGIATLAASGSRTMMAATVVAWLVVALRGRGLLLPAIGFTFATALVGIVVVAFGWFPNIEPLLGPLSRTGSSSEIMTLTGRTDLWAVAADLIAQKPLFGWGFNGTEALMVGSVGRAFEGDPVNTHNMYIQSILCLGFIGSLPGFALLGLLVTRMFTRPDAMRDQIVLLAMITGFAEVSIFATPVLLTLAFFLAVATDAADRISAADRRLHIVEAGTS